MGVYLGVDLYQESQSYSAIKSRWSYTLSRYNRSIIHSQKCYKTKPVPYSGMETESGCQCFCWIWWQRFIDQTLVVSIKYYWTISQVTCQLATNPCKTENQWLQVRVVELQCTNGLILLLPCIRITRVNEEGHSSYSHGPEMENGWLIQTKNAGEYFQLIKWLLTKDVLFEYHRAVVPFSWAVRPDRSLSTL